MDMGNEAIPQVKRKGDMNRCKGGDGVILRRSCGRPRVEDKYGPAFVDFMKSYVHSRGNLSLKDKGRLRDTLEAFTAPLSQLASEAKRHDFPISKTTMWKLFLPPRKDAVSSGQRGLIEAKRGTVVMSESHWTPRCCYSANVRRWQRCLFGSSCTKE